jgi:hypothetical protein
MASKTASLLASIAAVATLAVLAFAGAGCGSSGGAQSSADTDGGVTDGGVADGASSGDDTTAMDVTILGIDGPPQMGCSGYPGHDASALPGAGCCSSGPSHCIPASDVPPALGSAFVSCDAGLCVPDPIIAQGSEYVPTACTAKILTLSLEGVCLSECITLVSGNAQVSLLKQETCGTGELCVPCLNPLNNQPTGACSISSLVCGGDGGADAGGPSEGGGGPMCPYSGPPILDPTAFPACSPACSGAHCVPASLVPAADQAKLAACASEGGAGFCAPDTFIESAGAGVPKACTSIADSEGRCLSTCLPDVQAEANLLPQDICAANERCAPCYNPVAADPTMPTGACSLACDKPTHRPTVLSCPYTGPPIIDPTVFPACSPACAGAHCVPSSLVPAADQIQLATCPGGFCAPDSITSGAGKTLPATCTSIAGSEGRCLSTCLPAVAGQEALLPQSTCAAGERCAPCYNPVAADPKAATGACGLGCDEPAQPPTVLACPWTGPPVIDPTTLPACDSGGCPGAHCLPAAEVPTAVQSQLSPCGGGTGFCTPDPIISTANNFVPTTCDPFPGSGAPGRCLSACLPAVQKQASSGTLVQSTCTTGQYCVPCADPFTGASTSACALGCDKPPNPPFTFPKCCSDGSALTGTCVPARQVPASQQGSLDRTGNGNSAQCPTNGANYLCVPDEYLPPPYDTIPMQFCQATFLNLCGTCVSQCVNNSSLGLLGSDDCAANHKCVPCSLASGTPGCSSFCSNGAVCGNSCGCDADCASPCGVCSGGSGTCGDGSGSCDTR